MTDNVNLIDMEDVDGKRLRKSVVRITVDHRESISVALKNRMWQRGPQDRRSLQPSALYCPHLMPPSSYPDNPTNSVTTRFVKSVTSKERCPIFCVSWIGQGKRLITGSSSGEFTMWNGLTFNFETIMQAHQGAIRSMVWSHNDTWMISGDNSGYLKYWQKNLNCTKVIKAHDESVRGISFSPHDQKFVTCSDDGTLRVWDFLKCQQEMVLRGHGADVKCVQWHPQKALMVSGSKESQQSIKLWDPRTEEAVNTLHAHKAPVTDLKWNQNGNWLISASRDNLIKMFDLRKSNLEILTFRGHNSEVTKVAWHPVHEGLFSSASFDGSIMFWHADKDRHIGNVDQAHNSSVWSLEWHPVGHILCSGSNDHTTKFWTRNRPGDLMDDNYNRKNLPVPLSGANETCVPELSQKGKVMNETSFNSSPVLPGLGVELNGNSSNRTVSYDEGIPNDVLGHWNNSVPPRGEDNNVPEYDVPNLNVAVGNISLEQLCRVPPPGHVKSENPHYDDSYDNRSGNDYNDHCNQNEDYNQNEDCNRNEDYNRNEEYNDYYNSNDADGYNFHHQDNYNHSYNVHPDTNYIENNSRNQKSNDQIGKRNSSNGKNYRRHRSRRESQNSKFGNHHRKTPYQRRNK